MTIHIDAQPGDVAETILLPGDPLRAKYIAETFLTDPVCYNTVRGMLGYTGSYQGKRVSVQGTGMGMPSHAIYVHELITAFGVKNLIRVGSCGALQDELQLRDIVLAQTASTDSNMNRLRFNGMDFAPAANFDLLLRAYQAAQIKGIPVHVGGILSGDTFYGEDPDDWQLWAKYGVLAVEMETAALYTLAARFGVRALSIVTVSDSLTRHERMSPQDRETSFRQMIEIALSVVE